MNNKSKFLGMPIGTATGKLRKMIMFDLIKQLDKDFCYRCGERIKYIKDLSIDHKEFWLGVDQKLFWDLNNIVFSHLKCNTIDGKQKNPVIINGKKITRKYRDMFIGMPFGTAAHRLKKMIMFNLLQQLNKNFCYRCGKLIENTNDLSTEHKESWLYINKNLFWDIDNIAFSHLECNMKNKPRHRIETLGENCKKGFYWCSSCKKCLPVKLFGKDGKRYSGLRAHCKKCRGKEYKDYYMKKRPIL